MVILAMAVLVHVLVLVLIFISGKFGGSHCLLCLLVALFPGSVTMPRMGFLVISCFTLKLGFLSCLALVLVPPLFSPVPRPTHVSCFKSALVV